MGKRSLVRNYYTLHLDDISWLTIPDAMPDDWVTSYYFYHIQITNGKRDQLAQYLRNAEIYTTYRYFPLHRVAGYGISGTFPGADYAADNTLCLPMHQSLSFDELELIVEKIKEFGNLYC